MPDLLVDLLKLPPLEGGLREFVVRRAQPFELSAVRSFVADNFSVSWADEISVGFARQPISVFIAILEREVVGFAAYECTRRGFFGPMGVIDRAHGDRKSTRLNSSHSQISYAVFCLKKKKKKKIICKVKTIKE